MEKMKLHSPDFTQENIAKLAELFPNCITETRAEDGTPKKSIDFDQLRQELSTSVVEGPQERYQLNWPGKREALLTANAPIAKTLRPVRSESVDFDTTQNLFIEGDNLDALKLLQETYLNKVKMIYIDPPYNTGKEFVYDDDFAEDTEAYFKRSNQKDDTGIRMVANTEANGRFHSDWLSMMFARLRLALLLLRDDGVIFISIDDNEINNLRKLCEEIFGEDNFIAQIVWKKRSTPPNDKIIAAQHEYILCFAKNCGAVVLNLRSRTKDQIARYKNPDGHKKGPWVAGDLMANVKGGRYVASLYYAIVNPRTGQEHYPSSNGNWRFSKEKIDRLIQNDEIYFGEDDQGRPKLKRFLCDVKDGITWTTLWDFAPLNTAGSVEMTKLFGNLTAFENPKPTGLLLDLLRAGANKEDVILDFFAGSSSTADAVMQLNLEDGGKRRHIMVQLPDLTGEASEAFKSGFASIADLSKERIRRAGKKIKEELKAKVEGGRMKDEKSQGSLLDASDSSFIHQPLSLDIGFRVLKVDSSNMKDVYYAPDAVQQADLLGQVDNIRADRTPEDLLFQVLLDWGVDLALPITQETIAGKSVFFVDGNALAACFETGINEDFVKQLAARKPLRAVFRDAGFDSDSVKINVEQIFKLISPGTEVKTL